MKPLIVGLFFLTACTGTTGSSLVSFAMVAGGPENVTLPLEFDTGSGYHVTLSSATLHIGAVYLNMSRPTAGAAEQPCTLPGIYVGEAAAPCDATGRCGVDLDLLSANPIVFANNGHGLGNGALTGEVWLSGGDINAREDATSIFQTAGRATKEGKEWNFSALVTIGSNRKIATSNPAAPGANPICQERIVSPILLPAPIVLTDGGTLTLRVDARGMFHGVDFALLAENGGSIVIPDDNNSNNGVGGSLLKGISANSGVYQFNFTPKL